MNLYIDTNIVLDLLCKRTPFYESAAVLFTLGDKKKVNLFLSSLSFSTIHYILSKQIGEEKAREMLRKLKILVSILSVDNKIIELALNSDFKNFEDAIQYNCSVMNNIDILITRNTKNFKKAQISVMTADEFLVSIGNY